VKPAPFAYRRPETLEEAVRLLAELAPQDGRVLAGGQSLVPMMNFRLARPAYLIDINTVAGLDRLAAEDGVLRIGARVRYAAFDRPVDRGPLGAMLAGVARSGPGPDECGPPIRGLLHDQARRHGHGPVDLPFDHRGVRGTIVGLRE
jgi:hypothetical protein